MLTNQPGYNFSGSGSYSCALIPASCAASTTNFTPSKLVSGEALPLLQTRCVQVQPTSWTWRNSPFFFTCWALLFLWHCGVLDFFLHFFPCMRVDSRYYCSTFFVVPTILHRKIGRWILWWKWKVSNSAKIGFFPKSTNFGEDVRVQALFFRQVWQTLQI